MNTPSYIRKILAVSAAFMVGAAGYAQGQDNSKPWEEAVKRTTAIRIKAKAENEWRNLTMVDYLNRSLLVRLPKATNSKEMIAFPIKEFRSGRLQVEARLTKRMQQGLDFLEGENTLLQGIEILRPIVWPLIKALELPSAQTNFHEYIDLYLGALIQAKLADEAKAMVDYFNFKKISVGQTSRVVELINLFVEIGRSRVGFGMMSRLPMDAERADLQEIALDFGTQLRLQGRYKDAVAAYERLFTLEGGLYREKSILWSAYCSSKLGNYDSANVYLSLSEKFKPSEVEFSLKRLIEALILLDTGKPVEAMHAVSQGVVFSRLGLEWIAELMLTSGKAYEAVGRPEVAANVYRELIQFYPEDRFAMEAKELLEKLVPQES